jgi:hypothetical protein
MQFSIVYLFFATFFAASLAAVLSKDDLGSTIWAAIEAATTCAACDVGDFKPLHLALGKQKYIAAAGFMWLYLSEDVPQSLAPCDSHVLLTILKVHHAGRSSTPKGNCRARRHCFCRHSDRDLQPLWRKF